MFEFNYVSHKECELMKEFVGSIIELAKEELLTDFFTENRFCDESNSIDETESTLLQDTVFETFEAFRNPLLLRIAEVLESHRKSKTTVIQKQFTLMN